MTDNNNNNNNNGGGGGTSAPTGCYKCGQPGHWSRDCPFSPTTSNNPTTTTTTTPTTNNFSKSKFNNLTPDSNNSSYYSKSGGTGGGSFSGKSVTAAEKPKPKKVPRTRPKVTPELLLSDDGLGYILKYFPKNFKYRGRGHEVNDLKNLLMMYAEWHSQFVPYFPFDQFINKVESAGSAKRLKFALINLRERVANGGDPTKLKESEEAGSEALYKEEDIIDIEDPNLQPEELAPKHNGADDMQDDLFNEIFNMNVEESVQPSRADTVSANIPPSEPPSRNTDQAADGGGESSNVVQITPEQKALMEAKRQKALERAAARSRLLSSS